MKKTQGASQYHPRVHFVRESSNRKTGPIPVSTTASDSCPDACPLKNGGCYAKGGPLAIHWRKLDKTAQSTARASWSNFLENVAGLPDGQLWRHNQAGDLCGENNKISARFIRQLIKANKGKRGFTYTHKPVDNSNATNRLNAKLVAESNANGKIRAQGEQRRIFRNPRRIPRAHGGFATHNSGRAKGCRLSGAIS